MAAVFFSNRNSVKEFLSYLSSSLLVSIFEKFNYSARKRELSFQKVYLVDNSFFVFIPLHFSPDYGKLMENFVAVELQRRFKQTFFWENHGECDFVVFENNEPIDAIQVCYDLNENNQAHEIAGLIAECKRHKLSHGIILTFNQKESFQAQDLFINVLPVHQWLLM